jgi:hypothetical protein
VCGGVVSETNEGETGQEGIVSPPPLPEAREAKR